LKHIVQEYLTPLRLNHCHWHDGGAREGSSTTFWCCPVKRIQKERPIAWTRLRKRRGTRSFKQHLVTRSSRRWSWTQRWRRNRSESFRGHDEQLWHIRDSALQSNSTRTQLPNDISTDAITAAHVANMQNAQGESIPLQARCGRGVNLPARHRSSN
jgi:hypothetical protein